jgi:hypothetical protein
VVSGASTSFFSVFSGSRCFGMLRSDVLGGALLIMFVQDVSVHVFFGICVEVSFSEMDVAITRRVFEVVDGFDVGVLILERTVIFRKEMALRDVRLEGKVWWCCRCYTVVRMCLWYVWICLGLCSYTFGHELHCVRPLRCRSRCRGGSCVTILLKLLGVLFYRRNVGGVSCGSLHGRVCLCRKRWRIIFFFCFFDSL